MSVLISWFFKSVFFFFFFFFKFEDEMYALIAHLRKIPPLLLLSLIISSRWYLSARKSPYSLYPV